MSTNKKLNRERKGINAGIGRKYAQKKKKKRLVRINYAHILGKKGLCP